MKATKRYAGLDVEIEQGKGYAEFRVVTAKKLERWEAQYLADGLGFRGWSFSLFESKRQPKKDPHGQPIAGFVYVASWSCYAPPKN